MSEQERVPMISRLSWYGKTKPGETAMVHPKNVEHCEKMGFKHTKKPKEQPKK